MSGKIYLVTGANSGIGQATAVGLAKTGGTVVAVCRDQARGQAAVDEIKQKSKNDSVELLTADLSSLAAVRQLAADYKSRHDQLHGLVNNAGVMMTDRTTTIDGYETTFAVNQLAPFLLTNLLLDTLKASAPARIVNVMGNAGSVNFDDLMGERNYDIMRAYQQSKMANILFTRVLARRLEGTGVTANVADPGFVRSNLGRDARGSFKVFLASARPTMRSPEQGAEPLIYAASAPEAAQTTSKRFGSKQANALPMASYSDADAERLWQLCAELTGLEPNP
jgi:NAD(P)-dependent dehydrogenase (short-subunit alcohol dehydrogenase family)